MKTDQRLTAMLAAAFILFGSLPAFAVKADPIAPSETRSEITEESPEDTFFPETSMESKEKTEIQEKETVEEHTLSELAAIPEENESEEDEFEKDESEIDKSETDESKIDESEIDESKKDESEINESKKDESETDESETDESETDESETDESETDESETDESETDESETDESETDESETDKSETDKSETDKSETDKPEEDNTTEDTSIPEASTKPEEEAEIPVEDIAKEQPQPETAAIPEKETEPDFPVPDEAPAFHAHIEHPYMGYTVVGTFTDFTPDIVRIDTLYSLDGENWQPVIGGDWNLSALGTDNKDWLYNLQNQYCVYNAYEPMKSFTTGEIDYFYLKLCITKKNGVSYETQPASIVRGGLQPVPEGTKSYAYFSSSILVRESVPSLPYRFRMYGKYQLTVPPDAKAEDISALLPDTLPVEIELTHGQNFREQGVINCPVTWKPLSLPRLSAGESITIPDAAEEILVPAGTLVSTPLGVFELKEPLSLDSPPFTDEVRLILNVSQNDRNLTGVLKKDIDGLKIALNQKPTGATSIDAYVLTEGESKWSALPGLSLLKDMNAQLSTESSGFSLVLRNNQEPYQSYLAAVEAETEPTPFFIGLKFKGGVYDDRQLILPWPDIYEELPDLPKVGLTEGNEGNAGAGNKGDGTESGQRPNLPQISNDSQEKQPQDTVPHPDGSHGQQQGGTVSRRDGSHEHRQAGAAPSPDNIQEEQQAATAPPAHTPESASVSPGNQAPASPNIPVPDSPSGSQKDTAVSGRRPDLPQTAPDTANTPSAGQEGGPKPDPVARAAADIKEEKGLPALSGEKSVIEPAAKKSGLLPFFLAAAVLSAGGCIGVSVRMAGGHGRVLHRITGKIRDLLHR